MLFRRKRVIFFPLYFLSESHYSRNMIISIIEQFSATSTLVYYAAVEFLQQGLL